MRLFRARARFDAASAVVTRAPSRSPALAASAATCSFPASGRSRNTGRLDPGLAVHVHPHDPLFTALHRLLEFVPRALDLALRVAGLDGRDHAAAFLHLVHEGAGALSSSSVGQPFDEVAPAQRVDGVGHAGLVRMICCVRRARRAASGGEAQRLVTRWCAAIACRRAPRPALAAPRAPRCSSGCWAVSVDAGGLGSETAASSIVVLRAEAFLHDARPEAARGAELGHFLEEVVVHVEEERQPRRKVVHPKPAATPAST